MLSLNQLKNQDFSGDQVMSNIEKIILAFLTPEISLEAIEQAKKLSKEELSEAMAVYYDSSTANLFHSCLNWSNIEVYLKQENDQLRSFMSEWLYQQENFKTIKGQINLKSLNFKVNNEKVKSVLTNIDFDIDLSEVENFKAQLELLDESADQYFDACLLFNGKSFSLSLGQVEYKQPERVDFWKNNLTTALKATVLCSILFATTDLKAEDDTKRAISYATKAVMAQPEVKEAVDKTIKNAEKKAKEFVKETGTTIPATVIGYGIKTVVEGKVQVKGKGLKDLGVPMDYDIAVGFDNSFSLGVGGKNPYMKGSDYKIEGSKQGSEQKIQMKVNFEF